MFDCENCSKSGCSISHQAYPVSLNGLVRSAWSKLNSYVRNKHSNASNKIKCTLRKKEEDLAGSSVLSKKITRLAISQLIPLLDCYSSCTVDKDNEEYKVFDQPNQPSYSRRSAINRGTQTSDITPVYTNDTQINRKISSKDANGSFSSNSPFSVKNSNRFAVAPDTALKTHTSERTILIKKHTKKKFSEAIPKTTRLGAPDIHQIMCMATEDFPSEKKSHIEKEAINCIENSVSRNTNGTFVPGEDHRKASFPDGESPRKESEYPVIQPYDGVSLSVENFVEDRERNKNSSKKIALESNGIIGDRESSNRREINHSQEEEMLIEELKQTLSLRLTGAELQNQFWGSKGYSEQNEKRSGYGKIDDLEAFSNESRYTPINSSRSLPLMQKRSMALTDVERKSRNFIKENRVIHTNSAYKKERHKVSLERSVIKRGDASKRGWLPPLQETPTDRTLDFPTARSSGNPRLEKFLSIRSSTPHAVHSTYSHGIKRRSAESNYNFSPRSVTSIDSRFSSRTSDYGSSSYLLPTKSFLARSDAIKTKGQDSKASAKQGRGSLTTKAAHTMAIPRVARNSVLAPSR